MNPRIVLSVTVAVALLALGCSEAEKKTGKGEAGPAAGPRAVGTQVEVEVNLSVSTTTIQRVRREPSLEKLPRLVVLQPDLLPQGETPDTLMLYRDFALASQRLQAGAVTVLIFRGDVLNTPDSYRIASVTR
ncbi:unnamed protein product, partial [marine sediment metagenome]